MKWFTLSVILICGVPTTVMWITGATPEGYVHRSAYKDAPCYEDLPPSCDGHKPPRNDVPTPGTLLLLLPGLYFVMRKKR